MCNHHHTIRKEAFYEGVEQKLCSQDGYEIFIMKDEEEVCGNEKLDEVISVEVEDVP